MKKITAFHINGCPYCTQAYKAIDELVKENEIYKSVEINWIEEYEHPEIIAEYDYKCVPCMFVEDKKLYEGYLFESYKSCKNNIKKVFDYILAD